MTDRLPTRRATGGSERRRVRHRRRICEPSRARIGLVASEHRRRSDHLERVRSLAGEARRLLEPLLTSEPLGPVELCPCRPVRVAELTESSLRGSQAFLDAVVLASSRSEERLVALQLGREKGRNLARRAPGYEVDKPVSPIEIRNREGGIEGHGKRQADGLVGDLHRSAERFVDGPARRFECGVMVVIRERDDCFHCEVTDAILQVVALLPVAADSEVLLGELGAAVESFETARRAWM